MTNTSSVCALYISQNYGDDGNNGFYSDREAGKNGPVKTIERAISIVADMRKCGYLQPMSLIITDDVYVVRKPVVIDENAFGITIEPAAHTEIRGGVEIDNFIPDEFNSVKCLSADISFLENMDFSDFYVNGRPAKTTRYPKEGTLSPEDVENRTNDFVKGSKWFVAKHGDFEIIKQFKNIENAYISYYHYWIDEHSPIETVDENTGRITMEYVSRFNVTPEIACANMEYVIENIGEMFAEPGQWYCDKETKKLYYIPEAESKVIKGYIPITDKLFVIAGKNQNKVRNIRLRNLDFCYTKGEYKSIYLSDGTASPSKIGYASDIQSVCNGHGSIELENATGVSIESCRLNCLGVHAVNIKDGCFGITISGNHISYAGGGGVYANGGIAGSESSTHTYGIDISDNIIEYCGRRYYAACGMLLRNVYECCVIHNEISHMYYTGISCGWVWGYGDSICRDNVIQKNHIHHLGGGILSDMGGIYILGAQPGMVISGNVVHDITSRHYGGWAIYTDEGSRYITVENNICYNTSSNIYHQHYGTMNTVRNNIFAFSGDEVVRHSQNTERLGNICFNNIIVLNGNSPFRIRDNYDGKINAIKSCNNFIYDYTGKYDDVYLVVAGDDKNVCNDMVDHGNKTEDEYMLRYTFGDCADKLDMEQGSVFVDPEFVDINNYNFSLKATSPVISMGFKPIDVSDAGPRKK